jgi:fengycin family lipopeptide synthetase D
MIYKFQPGQLLPSVPIGTPVSNTQIYILDRSFKPVAVGVKGEVFIAGHGLASGYLSREDLTREKFIDNPFVAGEKMYKTGDWASRLADGNVIFRGRMDEQVKINGFRIELGEIEWHLSGHRAISSSIILPEEKDDNKYLIAWYVSENEIPVPDLRSFLSEKLPDYMIPSYFVHIKKLPLTPNGKLDRRALPDPVITREDSYARPANEIQEEIAGIWADVLKLDAGMIGVDMNFFDLGGNSMKMIRMINRVNKQFNANISIAKMFEFPFVSKIADHMATLRGMPSSTPAAVSDEGLQQMSDAFELYNQIEK